MLLKIMHLISLDAFCDELEKIAKASKIKSNSRMPSRTKENIAHFDEVAQTLSAEHKKPAVAFSKKVSPAHVFEIMHSMRRWYSGQTMARKLLAHRDDLKGVMKLDPKDVVGVYRGFKVPKDNPLANATVGQKLTIPVTRNHGFSSWSTTEAPTHKFSGGGKGKVGLVVRLIDKKGITPVLAPPEQTKPWFNAFYAASIGKAYRPTEGEYLISAPSVHVEVVRVKK